MGYMITTDEMIDQWGIWLQQMRWLTNEIAKLQKLNKIAKARGQTLAQLALAWVLRLPEVNSALIGASKVSQIEDAVGALKNLEFSQKELQSIDKILKA